MLTTVDQMKLNKYIREHALGDLYYVNMCEAIGKVNKVKDIEFLEYFVNFVIKEFSSKDQISMKFITKIISIIISFVGWIYDDNGKIDSELLDRIRSLEEYYDEFLERTKSKNDPDFRSNYLHSLLKKVEELYPEEKKSESVVEYLKEIDNLKIH